MLVLTTTTVRSGSNTLEAPKLTGLAGEKTLREVFDEKAAAASWGSLCSIQVSAQAPHLSAATFVTLDSDCWEVRHCTRGRELVRARASRAAHALLHVHAQRTRAVHARAHACMPCVGAKVGGGGSLATVLCPLVAPAPSAPAHAATLGHAPTLVQG